MLALGNLCIAYGNRPIVSDFSAPTLAPGRLISLLGPNGSGKSTLLKAMAGLTPVRRGSIVLNEVDLVGLSPAMRARHVAYLPQALPGAAHLRVFESVLVAAKASSSDGISTKTLLQRVDAVLQRLGIAHLALHALLHLSGGQLQLVGLAQALVRSPQLLLLDEPVSALDLSFQFHVMELLAQETKLRQMVTIVVLHDLNLALRHTDYALLLHEGKLLACGAPQEVITPEWLAKAYAVRARIEHCSLGKPFVMLDGRIHEAV